MATAQEILAQHARSQLDNQREVIQGLRTRALGVFSAVGALVAVFARTVLLHRPELTAAAVGLFFLSGIALVVIEWPRRWTWGERLDELIGWVEENAGHDELPGQLAMTLARRFGTYKVQNAAKMKPILGAFWVLYVLVVAEIVVWTVGLATL
jgi:hypothetical protein